MGTPVLPQHNPEFPDPPLQPPEGFRMSGWTISGIAGVIGTVPTPIPLLSAGAGVQTLTLENKFQRKVATYSLKGVAASFGLVDLGKRFPVLKPVLDRLKGRGGSVGPSAVPTFGSEILVTPWVKEPIAADEFACFAAITSVGAGFGPAGSLNAIVFSKVPFAAPIVGLIAGATIKGIGVFASGGISPPNVSADAFHADSSLKSVLPMPASP
jgi:hypothetical protein